MKQNILNEFPLSDFPENIVEDEGLKTTTYSEVSSENRLAMLTHYLHNPGIRPDEDTLSILNAEIADYLSGKAKNIGEPITTEQVEFAQESPFESDLFTDFFNVPFPGPEENKFTFIDLFAGMGGFRLAMQAHGGKCVFSSEWNKFAQKTYLSNFGEMPFGDITKESTKRFIPQSFDVLCAGFPCQPFSIAGVSKKNSLGRETGFKDKTQGTLFFDVADIISRHRPKAFFLENVKNLVSHDKGNTFKVIKETLEELRYSLHYLVMDGQAYVPQHRERIMIVGFDKDRYGGNETFHFPSPHPLAVAIGDILEPEVDEKYTLSDKLWTYLQNYAEKHKAKGNGFGFGLVDKKGISRTLSARYYKDGSEILIPQDGGRNPRRLSPRECARLMGYPDEYRLDRVSDVQAYRQCGNSVVVPLITDVAGALVTAMLNNK